MYLAGDTLWISWFIIVLSIILLYVCRSRKVYYFLYRVFNNYYVGKNYKDNKITTYLHEMFLNVLGDIEYSSEEEKIAMYNIVSNWTSVNREKSLKVYGKPVGAENEQSKLVSDVHVSMRVAFFLAVFIVVVCCRSWCRSTSAAITFFISFLFLNIWGQLCRKIHNNWNLHTTSYLIYVTFQKPGSAVVPYTVTSFRLT